VIVELLYFEGCPNHAPARELVERVITEYGISAEIRDIEVTDAMDAQNQRFLGSPTVRFDGVDVDPSAAALDCFGLMCRVYRVGRSSSGVPSREMIESALTKAICMGQKHADV
jgi:hypothetical protein